MRRWFNNSNTSAAASETTVARLCERVVSLIASTTRQNTSKTSSVLVSGESKKRSTIEVGTLPSTHAAPTCFSPPPVRNARIRHSNSPIEPRAMTGLHTIPLCTILCPGAAPRSRQPGEVPPLGMQTRSIRRTKPESTVNCSGQPTSPRRPTHGPMFALRPV
jgi:hypothetical protein